MITIKSLSLNTTTYAASVIGTSETVALSVNPNPIQDLTIAGTPAAGNTVIVVVDDAGIPLGEHFVGYRVKSGDSASTIACKLKTTINSDTTLKAIGINAACFSGVLSVEADSPNLTNIDQGVQPDPVDCTLVTPAPFPNATLKRCGTASDSAVSITQATLSALANKTQSAGGPLTDAASKLQASNYTWYVYGTQLEYFASKLTPGAHGGPAADLIDTDVPLGTRGLSYFGNPYFAVIFETFRINKVSNDIIANTVAHETGHLLDDVAYAGSSDSGSFQGYFDFDDNELDLTPACTVKASDQRNDPRFGGFHGLKSGVFSGAKDASGNFICNFTGDNMSLTSNYSQFSVKGTANLSILLLAYPQFLFNLDGRFSASPKAELFAQEYAVIAGFPDTVDNQGNPRSTGSDAAFGQVNSIASGPFACTYLYVRSLTVAGGAPTSTDLTGTGYLVPDGPIVGGPDDGYYGPGATLYQCGGGSSHGNYSFGS